MNDMKKRLLTIIGGIPVALILAGCIMPIVLYWSNFDIKLSLILYGIMAGVIFLFVIFSTWEAFE